MQYDIRSRDGFETVSVVANGELLTASNEHPNFDAIIAAVVGGEAEDDVAELFDASEVINGKFEELSERVSVRNGVIYFDGEPVDNSLTQQVVRFHSEGLNFGALVNFFEKVTTNPNEHSREQLFDWLKRRSFSITDDGDIVAYKSVYSRGDGVYGSVATQGSAIVNGEPKKGSIPQSVGDVVTMPRNSVQHDPSVGCHTGLHAGTWDYAKDFSGDTILTVAVNPRDVVSVPTDCDAAKIRTCRYKVLDVTASPHQSAQYDTYEDDDLGFEGADVEHWYEDNYDYHYHY